MKISTKVECGIIALVDICIHADGDEVVTIVTIARRQNLSAKYLEQIVPLLKHADIIRSVKGAKGGYRLSRSPQQINMKQVVTALDSTVLSDAVFDQMEQTHIISAIDKCMWNRMSDSLRNIAEQITLADIAEHYGQISDDNSEQLMYYI